MVASSLDALAPVLSQVVEPAAVQVDQQGAFPRASVDALGRAGMLGLVSAREVGGGGEGLRAARWSSGWPAPAGPPRWSSACTMPPRP